MKEKKNNNLKSFSPPLKDPCFSSNSSIIDLHQKTNLASPTPQAPVLVSQPSSSFFFFPPLHYYFQTCISITNSQIWRFYYKTSIVFIMMKNSTFAIKWLQAVILCLFYFKKPMLYLKKILIISRIVWGNIYGSKTLFQNKSRTLPLELKKWKTFIILNNTQLKALRVVCLDWKLRYSILNML